MAHDRLQASVRAMVHVRVRVLRSPWQRYVMLLVLFVSSEMLFGFADAGERARPVRIGALTSSWGPSPQVVGLRDGLVELGYREYEHFILGVRFTAGDLAALPAAARELVQGRYSWDVIAARLAEIYDLVTGRTRASAAAA